MPTATWLSSLLATIDGQAANQNTSYSFFNVGVATLGGSKSAIRRTCIRFDLSQAPDSGTVPPNPQIASARLIYNVTNSVGAPGWAARIQRITQQGWTGYPSTTWLKYDGVNPWAVTGGDVDTVHPVLFTATAALGPFAVDGLGDIAKDAVDSRAGLCDIELKSDEEGLTVTDNFVATSAGAQRPALELTYAGSATIDRTDRPRLAGVRPAFIGRPHLPGRPARPAIIN